MKKNALRTKHGVVGVAIAAMVLIVGLAIVYWLFTEVLIVKTPEDTLNASSRGALEQNYYSSIGKDGKSGWRDIDYTPGERGNVVVEETVYRENATPVEIQEFLDNWHDRSWTEPSPLDKGRYIIAHYEMDDANDYSASFIAGEVLVVFPAEMSDEYIETIAHEVSDGLGTVDYRNRGDQSRKLAMFWYEELDTDPVEKAQFILKQIPEAVAAFPNIVNYGIDKQSSSSASSVKQTYLPISNFSHAWEKTGYENTSLVAVLDSGIDMDHPDLITNIDYENSYDAISRQFLSESFDDVCGHGTVVSGIIAAEAGNDIGIEGCSYNATILPVRVLDEAGKGDMLSFGEGSGHLFDLDVKPDVVNMSLGFAADEWWRLVADAMYGSLYQDMINELTVDYGVVFVAAAGNDGKTDGKLAYPAALDNVMGVGSVSSNLTHSDFSNANNTVDICALGEQTYSTTDPLSEFGSGSLYADTYEGLDENGEEVTFLISGTSFAAPQVAAAAALLKSQNPGWSAAQIEGRLEQTSKDLGETGRDNEYGYGLLDVAAAVGWKYSPQTYSDPLKDLLRERGL